jgi:hypothetical protein
MNNGYLKLFRRLLHVSILNVMTIYRNKPGKGTISCHSEFSRLFVEYANTAEHEVLGQLSSDNTVPRLTERHFINKIPQTEKKP